MKKNSIICISLSMALLSGCSSERQFSGMVSGAGLGAILGSSVGGLTGGYRGHELGTVIGMVTGGAVGAAATADRAPKNKDSYEDDYEALEKTPSRHKRKAQETAPQKRTVHPEHSPLLLRNLRFIDDGRNQTLNRNETGKIIFELINTTKHTLRDVVPYIAETNGNTHIYLSPSTRIESITPGNGIRYTATVKTDGRLKAGEANFSISVSVDGGEFVTLREFSLTTAK